MLQSRHIKSSALKRLVVKGDESKIKPEWRARVKRIIAALNIAVSPAELDMPGFGWHVLKGDRKDTYSVTVSGNWRITFKWNDDGPFEVQMEDYHGR